MKFICFIVKVFVLLILILMTEFMKYVTILYITSGYKRETERTALRLHDTSQEQDHQEEGICISHWEGVGDV